MYQIISFLYCEIFHCLHKGQNCIGHVEHNAFGIRDLLCSFFQIFSCTAHREGDFHHCFRIIVFCVHALFLKLTENTFCLGGDNLQIFCDVVVSDLDEVLEQAVIQKFVFYFIENSTIFFQLAQRTISLVAFVGGYQRIADQCPYIALCGFWKLLLQHLSGS